MKIDFKAGDKFKAEYPFKAFSSTYKNLNGELEIEDGWSMGCHIEEDSYTADGLGEIEFEVLAVVEMPRKYQTRILYTFRITNPDDEVKSRTTCHTATLNKFNAMIERPYRADYEVNR